jgi:hypothetical protein
MTELQPYSEQCRVMDFLSMLQTEHQIRKLKPLASQ